LNVSFFPVGSMHHAAAGIDVDDALEIAERTEA
jgi:hypothetical protein